MVSGGGALETWGVVDFRPPAFCVLCLSSAFVSCVRSPPVCVIQLCHPVSCHLTSQ